MSDREAMKLALEALLQSGERITLEAIAALRARLAAPRPEPVAFFDLQKQVFYWAKPTMIDAPMIVALKPLPLYAAPPAAAPEPEPEKRHPGYCIGNHWLETAYERLCAGEAEDAILEDYELAREPRLRSLRRDAERYRWLRERAWFQFEFDGRYGDSGETVQQLDAAVDAVMEASTAPTAAATDASTAPEVPR